MKQEMFLLNILGNKKFGNEICPVYVIFQKIKKYKNIIQSMWPEN